MVGSYAYRSVRLLLGVGSALGSAWLVANCGGGGPTYWLGADASAGAAGSGSGASGTGGGSGGSGGAGGNEACTSDDDCEAADLVCENGSCVPRARTPCTVHAECPAAQHCRGGSCAADVCEAGLASCDGNSVALCDTEGSGFTSLVPCGVGTVCVATQSSAICEADGSGGGAGTSGAAGSGGDAGSGGSGNAGGAGGGGAAGSGGAAGTGGAGGSGGGTQGLVTKIFGELPGADHTGVTIDTKIRGDSAAAQTYDYGGGWFFGPDASPITHALLRFNVSAIPINSEVLSAVLELWTGACANCQGNSGTSVDIFRVLEAWVEGSADSEVTPTLGYCNWNNRNSTTLWSGPGAEPPSRAATRVTWFAPLQLDSKYSVVITSLVQDWVSTPSNNHGVLLKMVDPQFTDGVAFVSSENNENASSPGKRPRLIVQYQQP